MPTFAEQLLTSANEARLKIWAEINRVLDTGNKQVDYELDGQIVTKSRYLEWLRSLLKDADDAAQRHLPVTLKWLGREKDKIPEVPAV
jgi:glycerol kinase